MVRGRSAVVGQAHPPPNSSPARAPPASTSTTARPRTRTAASRARSPPVRAGWAWARVGGMGFHPPVGVLGRRMATIWLAHADSGVICTVLPVRGACTRAGCAVDGADVQPDVPGPGRGAGPGGEQQVPGRQRSRRADRGSGVDLQVGGAGDGHAGGGPGAHGQPGAVERAGPGGPPHVRFAQLGEGERDHNGLGSGDRGQSGGGERAVNPTVDAGWAGGVGALAGAQRRPRQRLRDPWAHRWW